MLSVRVMPIVMIIAIAVILRVVVDCPIVLGESVSRNESGTAIGSAECDTVCGDLRDRHAGEPLGSPDRRETGSRVNAALLPCWQQASRGRQVPQAFDKGPARLRSRVRCGPHLPQPRFANTHAPCPLLERKSHVCDLAKSASR
jgi:hypothetical protein